MRSGAVPGLVLVFLFAVSLGGCGGGGADGLLSFGVDVDIDETTVSGFADPPLSSCELEPVGDPGEVAFGDFTLDFDAEEEFEGRGAFAISRLILERIVLRVVNEPPGDSDDFDFVDAIRVFAEDPESEEEPRLVAELDPVPEGVKEIVIPGTGVDISDLLSANRVVGRVEASGRPPCDDVNVAGMAEFDVTIF